MQILFYIIIVYLAYFIIKSYIKIVNILYLYYIVIIY